MNQALIEKVESILAVGHALHAFGVNNWALSQADALDAIEKLAVAGVAILGGDVYIAKDGRFEMNYDNWHCDGSDEDYEIFVRKSAESATEYIRNYKAFESDALFAGRRCCAVVPMHTKRH